jgi:hypothetical protein
VAGNQTRRSGQRPNLQSSRKIENGMNKLLAARLKVHVKREQAIILFYTNRMLKMQNNGLKMLAEPFASLRINSVAASD